MVAICRGNPLSNISLERSWGLGRGGLGWGDGKSKGASNPPEEEGSFLKENSMAPEHNKHSQGERGSDGGAELRGERSSVPLCKQPVTLGQGHPSQTHTRVTHLRLAEAPCDPKSGCSAKALQSPSGRSTKFTHMFDF